MDSRSSSILLIAGVTAISGFLAYAAYFDYKRRNDVDFRKKLRKEKKRVDKSLAESQKSAAASTSSTDVTPALIREALEQVKNEGVPSSPEEKETYFMTQVSRGEQLITIGPDAYFEAAKCFFRALRVYPTPVELIVIYERTMPSPVFKIIMDMTNLDVSGSSSPPNVDTPQSPGDDVLTDDETSPTRKGPPSEASSQEWDKVTDPGTHTPALSS